MSDECPKCRTKHSARYLSKLHRMFSQLPEQPTRVVEPAAEVRSVEDYEQADWDAAFEAEVGRHMRARNEAWDAFMRAEMAGEAFDHAGRIGQRPGASFSAGHAVGMHLNNAADYAPPGGKLLRSDVAGDVVRHTFADAAGIERVCEASATSKTDELSALEAFKAEWQDAPKREDTARQRPVSRAAPVRAAK